MEDQLKNMNVELYNIIGDVLRSYGRDISPYEAFADEISQNFFDTAKRYIEECKQNNISPQNPVMYIYFNKYAKEGPSIWVFQKNTTGIRCRKEYVTYGLTQKPKDPTAAGSQGVGWKIWLTICASVETETITNEKYYQTILKTIDNQIKVLHTDEWSENQDIFQKRIKNNGETLIKFINIKKGGFYEDGKEYFEEIKNSWEKLIEERYFWVFQKYAQIQVEIIEIKDTSGTKDQRKIKGSSLPSLFPGLKDEECRLGDIKIIEKRDVVYIMKDVFVGFTIESLNKEGIAIVVRDRIVEWYNPTSRAVGIPGVDGYLFGFAFCDYLYKKDIITHDSLNDNFPEVAYTRAKIRQLVANLYARIQDLHSKEAVITTKKNDVISNLNDILKGLLGEEEMLPSIPSSESEELKGEQGPGIEISLENLVQISLSKLFVKDTSGDFMIFTDKHFNSSDDYKADFDVVNKSDKPLKGNLKITARQINLKISIPITLDIGLNKIDFPFPIPASSKLGTFNMKLEFRDSGNNSKGKKIISFSIQPLIVGLSIDKNNVNRGDIIQIKYTVKRSLLPGTRILSSRLLDSEKNEIHAEEPERVNKNSVDKTDTLPIKITESDPRGSYTFEVALKFGNDIIQEENMTFYVENYIKNIRLSKKFVKFNEKFSILVDIENPTETEQDDILIGLELEQENRYYYDDFVEKISIKPGEIKTVEFKDLTISDKYDTGCYYITISLELPEDTNPETQGSTITVEALGKAESRGLLKEFSYFQNERSGINPKVLAINSNGSIKVNTFHYLFRKIENENGIDLDKFKEFIAQAVWFSYKDTIQKDSRFQEMWEFEKYLLEDKKLRGI